MRFSFEQAKVWAKKTFERAFDRYNSYAMYSEGYTLRSIRDYESSPDWHYDPIDNDWYYEHRLTKEEIRVIRTQAQKDTAWAVNHKFGKKFKHAQLMSLHNYVKGLH